MTDNTAKLTTCMHCGNRLPLRLVSSHDQSSSETLEFGLEQTWTRTITVYVCPTCEEFSIYRTNWSSDLFDNDHSEELLYPPSRSVGGLPPAVKKAFDAALRTKHVDPNAFAVLLGRVLEIVTVDRGASGATLYDRIQQLSERGEIPAKLLEVATALRGFRNVGAHADLGELTAAEVPLLESLTRAILEYVYAAPLLLRAAEKKLAALKGRSNELKNGDEG